MTEDTELPEIPASIEAYILARDKLLVEQMHRLLGDLDTAIQDRVIRVAERGATKKELKDAVDMEVSKAMQKLPTKEDLKQELSIATEALQQMATRIGSMESKQSNFEGRVIARAEDIQGDVRELREKQMSIQVEMGKHQTGEPHVPPVMATAPQAGKEEKKGFWDGFTWQKAAYTVFGFILLLGVMTRFDLIDDWFAKKVTDHIPTIEIPVPAEEQ